MNITEKQKKELFDLAKGIRIRRDTALNLCDQATTKQQKEHFLRLSIVQAAKEYGITICFQILGVSKEFADFIGDTKNHLPLLLFEKAFAAEKNFIDSFHVYHSIYSGNREKERQKCQENLAIYKSYLRVFTILEITGEYEAYKDHC